MENKEFQVEIRISESHMGVPITNAKKFMQTYWIAGTATDMPHDVLAATNRIVAYKEWN